MRFVHLKTSGFFQVLRTRDRIVRSNTWFIYSLLSVRRLLRLSALALPLSTLPNRPHTL